MPGPAEGGDGEGRGRAARAADADDDEVSRLTAMIAATNTAMLPETTLCSLACRAAQRAALDTLIA